MYASNPRVVMAYKISSPVMVFLFSCMHRSFALWTVKEILKKVYVLLKYVHQCLKTDLYKEKQSKSSCLKDLTSEAIYDSFSSL